MQRTALIIVGLILAAVVDRSTSTATGVVLPWVQGDIALSGDQAPLVTLSYNGAFYAGILLGPRLLLRFGRVSLSRVFHGGVRNRFALMRDK